MASDGEKLLEAAAGGSVEAFEMLTEGYMKKVYNILLTNCGNSETASKLTQEVFVRLFKNVKSVKKAGLIGFRLYKTAAEVYDDFSISVRKIS